MTDIKSNQSNANLTNNERMTDDKLVAEVEEGVFADSPQPTRPFPKTVLSMVSRKYDIDGDGVLDETELASKPE
jgi:hypothetical protein